MACKHKSGVMLSRAIRLLQIYAWLPEISIWPRIFFCKYIVVISTVSKQYQKIQTLQALTNTLNNCKSFHQAFSILN